MANYKVSYKMLAKQGDEMKAVAKLIDGYAERVGQIGSKLGDDQMLAEVRKNLKTLQTQLSESRMMLDMAGELLTTTVQTYSNTEKRQVKKVDSLKAHNRDFYKNPVVVASAGGAATAAAAPAPVTNTTVNYTDNSSVSYAQTTVAAEPVTSSPAPVAAVEMSAPAAVAAAAPAAAQASAGSIAGIAAGAGVAGGALGTAAVLGVKHLLDEDKEDKKDKKTKKSTANNPDGYDPERELAAAIERVRRLEKEG